jgi:hypothetical protein
LIDAELGRRSAKARETVAGLHLPEVRTHLNSTAQQIGDVGGTETCHTTKVSGTP